MCRIKREDAVGDAFCLCLVAILVAVAEGVWRVSALANPAFQAEAPRSATASREIKWGEPVDGMNNARPTALFVNGEPRELAAHTLAQALVALDYADAIVATALNGEFVPARKREATLLREGDRIEIVAPRQGG
jgi:sulfur carrier protein